MPEIGNKTAQVEINLIDKTFDVSQSESYHLSIQAEADGLSFCVLNTVLNKYIVLRSYPFLSNDPDILTDECRSVFEIDELLGLRYKSSSHLWISPWSTLVPHHLFDPDEADTCLAFNHGKLTGEQTQYHFVKPVNLYNIFSCPETLTALLRKYQPDISLFHQTSPVIGSVIRTSRQFVGMAVFFYSRYLDIVVVENNRLLFYNTFQINTPEDSVYYLMGVSNLFNIDLLSTRLMYVGDLKCMPSEIEILKGHVGQMVECEPSSFTYSHYMSVLFRKKFFNLFNLYGCES